MTIQELNKKYFGKIDYLDLELIISHVIKKSRSFILAHPEQKLTAKQAGKIESLLKRRVKWEPLAYILGHKEFYGLEFKVNKNVLVPRPETELIVDEVLDRITHNAQRTTIIDVGTGSGCIITTLAKILESRIKNKESRFFAIDISKKALFVAKKNASLHDINKKIKFMHGNLLEPIIHNSKFIIPDSELIITANLPYLTPKQVKESPSIQREPKLALIAGPDGLKYYRELFKQIKKLKNLRPDLNTTIFCEIDHTQTKNLQSLLKKELPIAESEVLKDIHCLDRIITITI